MRKLFILMVSLWSSLLWAQSAVDPENTARLLEMADHDAYQLSVPLLIAAQTDDKKNYQAAMSLMIPALEKLATDKNKTTLVAWLYGRMALAANFMQEKSDAEQKLKKSLNDPNTPSDHFKAWAYGYFASLNHQDYQDAKVAMQNLANDLTQAYHGENQDKLTPADITWIWVMVMQASAQANDQQLYTTAIKQILDFNQMTSLAIALEKAIPLEDFYLWANAICYVAATQMQDNGVAYALKQTLDRYLNNSDPKTADVMLAQATMQRATPQTPALKLI